MQRFFPTKPGFESLVIDTIGNDIPMIGVHIRTGHNEVPDFRHVADVNARVDRYVNCSLKLCSEERIMFVAADTSHTLDLFQTKMAKSGWNLTSANGLGEIGHNSFVDVAMNDSVRLTTRLMVDFEILRRVPIMIASLSGFSLMAYRTRYFAASIGVIGSDQSCMRIPTKHEGSMFSVANW